MLSEILSQTGLNDNFHNYRLYDELENVKVIYSLFESSLQSTEMCRWNVGFTRKVHLTLGFTYNYTVQSTSFDQAFTQSRK